MTMQDVAFTWIVIGIGGGVFVVGFLMLIWAALASEFEKRQQSQRLGMFSQPGGERGAWVGLSMERRLTKWEESGEGAFLLVKTRKPMKGFVAPGPGKDGNGAMLEVGMSTRPRHLM